MTRLQACKARNDMAGQKPREKWSLQLYHEWSQSGCSLVQGLQDIWNWDTATLVISQLGHLRFWPFHIVVISNFGFFTFWTFEISVISYFGHSKLLTVHFLTLQCPDSSFLFRTIHFLTAHNLKVGQFTFWTVHSHLYNSRVSKMWYVQHMKWLKYVMSEGDMSKVEKSQYETSGSRSRPS